MLLDQGDDLPCYSSLIKHICTMLRDFSKQDRKLLIPQAHPHRVCVSGFGVKKRSGPRVAA